MSTPVDQLPADLLQILLYGAEAKQKFTYESRSGHSWKYETPFEGVINNLQRRVHARRRSDFVKEEIEKYMSANTCPTCKGARLKPEALAVTFAGMNVHHLTTMSVEKRRCVLPRLRSRRSAKN